MKYLLLLLFLSSSAMAQSKLILSLGETRSLHINNNDSVWIQDRDILKAEGRGSSVSVKGLREGHTTLKIGATIYQVQVLHPTKTNSIADLEKHLKKVVGLNAQLADGDLLVTGQLYRFQDWQRLSQFTEAKSLNYQMRAAMTPQAQEEAQKYFRDLFMRASLPPQTILWEPQAEIRINVPALLFSKYIKLLAPFGIQILRDEASLDIAPTVKVQITIAEIKRETSIKYGLRWPSSYSANVLPDGSTQFSELPFNVNAFEGQGLGKILASPNILCRSGKEAEFLAGGEFPIKIMNLKIQDVIWKRYGILLKVKPKADAAGRISLSIETEVSTIDDARKVDDIPGILTNRVSSHFDLTKSQTIALSGLLKNEDGKSSEGMPLLSRLPILGALFSSKDFRESRSELVIFVRPTILKEGEDTLEKPSHLGQ